MRGSSRSSKSTNNAPLEPLKPVRNADNAKGPAHEPLPRGKDRSGVPSATPQPHPFALSALVFGCGSPQASFSALWITAERQFLLSAFLPTQTTSCSAQAEFRTHQKRRQRGKPMDRPPPFAARLPDNGWLCDGPRRVIAARHGLLDAADSCGVARPYDRNSQL